MQTPTRAGLFEEDAAEGKVKRSHKKKEDANHLDRTTNNGRAALLPSTILD